MGSDESHFNVSVGSDGQCHKTVSTNHSLFEEKGEPKRSKSRAPYSKTGTQESPVVTNWMGNRYVLGFAPALSQIVQELCESRGGRPGLSVLTSLLVSVNVKLY